MKTCPSVVGPSLFAGLGSAIKQVGRYVLAALFLTSTLAASAQVSVTSNPPPYGFEVMSGAIRTIPVYVSGGATNLVNWSATGGATLSCTLNCPAVVTVTITAPGGTCSVTGSIGSYVLQSTSDVILTAQSVDDPTQTATVPFHVCDTTADSYVDVEPSYNQAFRGQQKTLQSYVVGNTNEAVTWAITSSPSGGDGALADTINRDTLFSATVPGRYTITATSVANGSLSGSAIVYVSPNALPRTVTPNKTEPTECYVDPALTGTDYEVGPSQAYHNIRDVSFLTWTAGSIVRIHNEDTTGTAPTTYHEAAQIQSTGTPTQPLYICGVADAAGNLPVIDGSNAQESPNNSIYVAGLGAFKIVYSSSGYGQGYGNGSTGPDYLSITGLRIQNFDNGFAYYPNGGSTLTQYTGSGGIYLRSGQHLHFEGLDMDHIGFGVMANNNTAYTGRSMTQFHQVIGSHFINFSDVGSAGEHALYMEAFDTIIEGNLFENPLPGSSGDFMKVRGGDSIIRYNVFRGDVAGHVIEYPDMEDTWQFVGVDMNLSVPNVLNLTSVTPNTDGTSTYWGTITGGGSPGMNGEQETIAGFSNPANNGTFTIVDNKYNYFILSNTAAVAETNSSATATRPVACLEAVWCYIPQNYATYPANGVNITLGQLAENAEKLAKDFVYGNVISNPNTPSPVIQYGSFSAPEECAPCSNMDDRQGRLYFFSNTVDEAPAQVFQTDNPYYGGYIAAPQYSQTSIFTANNAFWNDPSVPFTLNLDATMVASFQTNMFPSGAMNLTTPILGSSGGWGNFTNAFSFTDAIPLETHLTGLSSANFLTASSAPYNPISFAPVPNSPLTNAGSPITDPIVSKMPVRFQPDPAHGWVLPRKSPLTIGAVESGTQPTFTGVTVVPASVTLQIGDALDFSAICNYSDGSSVDCTVRASWSSTLPSNLIFWSPNNRTGHAYVESTGFVLAQVDGLTGTGSWSIGSAPPPPVTPPPPPPASSVSISVAQPPFGFNVIPGSVRRVFATVTNGSTNGVTWAVKSGSATLSSNSGLWVDVTAPTVGSSCSYGIGANTWTVSSSTQFVIEATSTDDPTQSFDLTFNVCNPKVQVDVVPFYRTLYANQPADIQSMVKGSVNLNVHWAITDSPSGGDGTLTDSTSRDAVFSATVPGRYVLTATSVQDPTVSSSAIMYVTGHPLPTYKVTPNMTQPVDCSVDPAMLGTVYEVGPSQSYKTLASVPFPTMVAGSTVRLHNEDTTGSSPTTYHEYVQISQAATATQPFRICGVPDSQGNLPVMDASAASGRSDASFFSGGYGLITLQSSSSTGLYPNYSGPSYIAVEGIKFQNAQAGVAFTAPNGSGGTWTGTSAAIRLFEGHNVAIVGNDIYNNGNGVFSDFTTTANWGGSAMNILWEGNHLHGNGASGSALSHQMNLQAWNEIAQFNRIENYPSSASGANIKSRSLGTVIRYNYLGDGASRQMDLAEVQDATTYMTFAGYLNGYPSSFHDLNVADTYTADLLAAAQEEWNSHFVYGNIYQNLSSTAPIHFGYDTAGDESARKGSLYWYNNSFYEELCSACSGQAWTLFDTQGANGQSVAQAEYPTVQVYNNVLWSASTPLPEFSWNNYSAFIGVAGANLLPANWGTNDQTGGIGTGWNISGASTAYQNATKLSTHLTGFTSGNLSTASSMPFDATTWILNSETPGSTAVPPAVCEMPVRFSYLPSLGYAVPRLVNPNMGATDTVPEIASTMTSVGGTRRYNTRNSNCR
jgi:hypothetical protein